MELKRSYIFLLIFSFVIFPFFSENAKVTYTKGKVEVLRNEKWQQLKVGDYLQEKDIVSTGFNSETKIIYKDSVMNLGALTRITFEELSSSDFEKTPERAAVFENADVLILDSQYTVEEAAKKVNWGHSAFCYAVDFAIAWKIKKLYLFHHETTYDDKKLNSILESARWYANYITQNSVKVYLSTEGLEIHL